MSLNDPLLAQTDPFTLVGERIEKALRDCFELAGVVCTWQSFTDIVVMNSARTLGDLPELRLHQSAVAMNPWATSSSATVTQTYNLQYLSGEVRLDIGANPFKWALLKALYRARSVTGGALVDLVFVKRVTVQSMVDQPITQDQEEPQWTTIAGIVVDMYFAQSDLLENAHA